MENRIRTFGSKTASLFDANHPGAPLVVLNGEVGEGEAVWQAVHEISDVDFALLAVGGLDWNRELSPWPAPPVFKGEAPFCGEADRYLAELTEVMLPAVQGDLSIKPAFCAIAGYSLAGLFALYALYHTDLFSRAASVSGSLWYPGFVEYAQSHDMMRQPERVCLSVGDREARTRNPVMRTVEENTRVMAKGYSEKGIETTFDLNPGGHFQEPGLRVARAIAKMLQ